MSDSLPYSARDLASRFGASLYPASIVRQEQAACWLMRTGRGKQLAILARPNDPCLPRFAGESQAFGDAYVLHLCAPTHANARALRELLPWLKPAPLGPAASAGFGDRLGLATPGHVRALKAIGAQFREASLAPIFAQQSIREMARTGRTPDDVLSDATWGAFEAGWRGPLGADADHLKSPADIDLCATAGFSFFTFDPGAHVDSAADTAAPPELGHKLDALPWAELGTSPEDMRRRFSGRTIDFAGFTVHLADDAVLRAAVKYGQAVAHLSRMYRHLAARGVPFEVEISVDETETPTTHAEHYVIACELKRLRVRWVSLAPRFVGRFEKGVDYLGRLESLQADLAGHAAIARALGPYKLSLHSGSDKFSVYASLVEATRGLAHLKTAGTSYLEALRAIAGANPALFRKIAALALARYPSDRVTYHVSADAARVPALSGLGDDELAGLLDHFDMRQVLHVTFGSALAEFGAEIKATLRVHEEAYYAGLAQHFVRHLEPFARNRGPQDD